MTVYVEQSAAGWNERGGMVSCHIVAINRKRIVGITGHGNQAESIPLSSDNIYDGKICGRATSIAAVPVD
jgi:hypothetical protein